MGVLETALPCCIHGFSFDQGSKATSSADIIWMSVFEKHKNQDGGRMHENKSEQFGTSWVSFWHFKVGWSPVKEASLVYIITKLSNSGFGLISLTEQDQPIVKILKRRETYMIMRINSKKHSSHNNNSGDKEESWRHICRYRYIYLLLSTSLCSFAHKRVL